MSPRFAATASYAVVALLTSPAFAANPATDRLTFSGSTAPGTTSITFSGGVYTFLYTGDETIRYQIDLNDPKVAGGMIRIKETSSDSYPIDGGGFTFRDQNNAHWFPWDEYKKTVMTSHVVSGNVLTIEYLLTHNGQHPIRYEFTHEKKVLRVRVVKLNPHVGVTNNFSGLYYGSVTGVENPLALRIQGELAMPLIMFRNGPMHYFTGNVVDLLQSNASDYHWIDPATAAKGPDWIKLFYDTASSYRPMSTNQLAGALDDTFVIAVSSKVKDVLITSSAPATPYHGLLANRMFFNGPENHNWSWYSGMFDLYASLGMHNLAGYFWAWSGASVDPPLTCNGGPDWAPAKDPVNFKSMVTKGVGNGALVSGYTAFNCVPPTAPGSVINPAHYARDAAGNVKMYPQAGFPNLAVEASGIFAQSEANALKAIGANSVYVDIQTYASVLKGGGGDHLDEQGTSPWAKTIRKCHSAQKVWLEQMRTTLNGPVLGEGSIGNAASNSEFLWYGYVDSVQRCINYATNQAAGSIPAGSPNAVTNLPIIPEYEWRVAAAKQVNHGNGFYDRFFGPNDGPTVVEPNGVPTYPLSQNARDLYQAWLISHGHAGYVITNGTQSSTQGYITHPGAAETYFMSNALQTQYFSTPVIAIYYFYLGSWKTFEQVIFQTETTETFRKIPVVIVFQSGLRIYVNHGTSNLPVIDGGATYTLPSKTGWLAYGPGQILAFSAIPSTTSGNRIDYCNAVGQYEYFNGRGVVSGFGGLSTSTKRTKYKVHTTNSTVTEDANGVLQVATGTPPALLEIKLFPSGSVSTGNRTGLRAIAFYANGALRDVTTMLKWFSSNGNVATVNSSGVCTGVAAGSITITTTAFGGKTATPLVLAVQ